MRWIAVCAGLALGMTVAACGGSETKAEADQGPLTAQELRAQADARCNAFVRDTLASRLPTDEAASDAWWDDVARREKQLVRELRALRPPAAEAKRYKQAVDARGRAAGDDDITWEEKDEALYAMAPFSERACRYWGMHALEGGADALEAVNGFCYEDDQRIEALTRSVRRGKLDESEAYARLAAALRKSANLAGVDVPELARGKWIAQREAVEDLAEAYAALGEGGLGQDELDALDADIYSALTRIRTGGYVLGLTWCNLADVAGEAEEAILAI